mmetsp:Transcript_113382/g.283970  ORF Transcript_113382/g.283970 Transcript_113382/m.283970 type:complete len:294 (+) Transcript_113382:652-1533(+)
MTGLRPLRVSRCGPFRSSAFAETTDNVCLLYSGNFSTAQEKKSLRSEAKRASLRSAGASCCREQLPSVPPSVTFRESASCGGSFTEGGAASERGMFCRKKIASRTKLKLLKPPRSVCVSCRLFAQIFTSRQSAGATPLGSCRKRACTQRSHAPRVKLPPTETSITIFAALLSASPPLPCSRSTGTEAEKMRKATRKSLEPNPAMASAKRRSSATALFFSTTSAFPSPPASSPSQPPVPTPHTSLSSGSFDKLRLRPRGMCPPRRPLCDCRWSGLASRMTATSKSDPRSASPCA